MEYGIFKSPKMLKSFCFYHEQLSQGPWRHKMLSVVCLYNISRLFRGTMPVSYEYLSAIRSPHKSINNGFPLFQDCPVFAIVLIL